MILKRLCIGDTLGGRYRIESLLGQGGMGQVFLAEDLKLKGKKWAIKECLRTDNEVESFLEEAEMIAQLKHPQLPQLIDYFTPDTEGYAYLVMDYIEGPTLQDLFDNRGKELSISLVVNVALQLCELFHYLHSFRPKAIIYRDLKPSNVMIDEKDQVRLIDFGIARHHTLGKLADTIQIGTIGFASPEQFANGQTDARSDLYNLGAMLFYLLSGGQYAYTTKQPLSQLCPQLPPLLVDTVQLLLQEAPEQRCQSALEVKHRLKVVLMKENDPTSSQFSESEALSPDKAISNRLIVVGGLYAGVGSSFVAVTLARVLNGLQIPNALVEHPTNEPDLYMQLYGDHRAPTNYTFASEAVMTEGAAPERQWENGSTTWVPIHPDGLKESWSTSDTLKLLVSVKKPIILWDVSSNWGDPAVQELCLSADDIIVVLDASPGKLNRVSTKQKLNQLLSLRASGSSVHLVANRELPSGNKQEWLDSLPDIPLCTIPELPYQEVMRSIWKGECVQDQPEWLEKLYEACRPLLRTFIPDPLLQRRSLKSKSFFFRFRRNG
ncbi:Serine/threonine-protein kinase PknB [compost metagenome]